MRRLAIFLVAVLIVGGIVGVSIVPTAPKVVHQAQPGVIVEVLDPALEPFAEMWRLEASRRFTNACVLLAHGGDFVAGNWIIGAGYAPHAHVTPVQDVVRYYQRVHPTRTIVLVSCNPGDIKLGIPNVYYARSNVWLVPDRAMTSEMTGSERRTFSDGSAGMTPKVVPVERPLTRWQEHSDFVGSIFEFVCD